MPTVALSQDPEALTLYYTRARAESPRYPPLLLVHGAGGSHLSWPPTLRRLPHADVIAPDLPGHGRSGGPGRADVRAYAEDMRALLDALALPRAVIVGHSMGGAIAQELALGAPERVAGLVLLGTGSKLPVAPELPPALLRAPEATVTRLMDWAWSAQTPDAVQQQGAQLMLEAGPQVLHDDFAACAVFDVRADVAKIAAPTLVVGGSDDRMVPPTFSRTLAESIPNAELRVLEGAGHMFPLERPQELAEVLADWLERQSW